MSVVTLSILSAFLLSPSFSSFNLWQFAWFGFLPLFIALEKKSLRQSFIIAYLWGVVFWIMTIYWLVHVTLIGQAVLILYLSLYFGLFGCAVYYLRFLSASRCLFFIPSAWVLLEYIRSHLFTGFPWALAGFSQYKNLPVIQIADITGAWGVSFLVILVNTALYLILGKQQRKKISLIISAILILTLGYGFYRLSYKPDLSGGGKSLKISVIQGNIPQELKWDKRAVNFILNNYKELTVEAAKDKPDLIIWPEASVPALWGQDDDQFRQIFSLARELKINLLAGVVSHFQPNYFNSALFIDQGGRPSEIYHKVHLVPFGEFVPFKDTFPFLQTIAPIGDIEPGRVHTIFKKPVDFGVLICFEDLFPELSRKLVKGGAKFLVNITNDAWYKEGSAPFQHLAASVFRAVENRVYLARSANTGISGFIAPSGRFLSVVRNASGREIFIRGYSSRNIYLAPVAGTVYNRYGDLFIILCLLLSLSMIKYKHA
ncbi:MAG: apolipoprotein N-acyltransferase [Candidatus Omnitrophica bacterium CG11_big_fil_rev_8_21_14_0_20_41_12]|nr:MAG: apolipoprotein N-acyltransferase [Candidatus Omnitrophica bacterium CG11_big_fil_rev_8_21_14_0_20_41_12]